MKFLCLVYFEPAAFAVLSSDEKAEVGRNSWGYDQQLQRSGNYIHAEALEPVTTARTVRVRRGKANEVDGPFAETKEHLGGFILVEAPNMDAAMKIAAGIPLAKLGSVEVRPVMTFSDR